MLAKGYLIINPGSLLKFTGLNDVEHRELIMNVCKAVVEQCQELVICSDITGGMWEEISVAKDLGIPITMITKYIPNYDHHYIEGGIDAITRQYPELAVSEPKTTVERTADR